MELEVVDLFATHCIANSGENYEQSRSTQNGATQTGRPGFAMNGHFSAKNYELNSSLTENFAGQLSFAGNFVHFGVTRI